jgi:ADP-ribose pyrophosphatase YjhB (NUDIX family)
MDALRRTLSPVAAPLFRTIWKFSRGMTLGVRGLAADGEGRVLLVRHTYKPGWYLPGGGVETGETAEEALIREMAEEGGVASEVRPALFGFYCNHRAHRNDHVALYRVPAWSPCAPDSDGEIAERGFFATHALPDGTTPATRRRLAELFAGAAIDPYW